jgi:hypothetical protein
MGAENMMLERAILRDLRIRDVEDVPDRPPNCCPSGSKDV